MSCKWELRVQRHTTHAEGTGSEGNESKHRAETAAGETVALASNANTVHRSGSEHAPPSVSDIRRLLLL